MISERSLEVALASYSLAHSSLILAVKQSIAGIFASLDCSRETYATFKAMVFVFHALCLAV